MSENNIQNKTNVQLASNNNILDKILPNNQNMKNDIMQFKDEILREIKLIKKSMNEKYDFTMTLINQKFDKYDNKLTSYSDRITELSSSITNNNDFKKDLQSLNEFKNKFRDSMLTMDIKINNMDKEAKNNIFRIDNILSDSVIYPGIIGRTSKFKTFHQMIDYILAQTSQNLTYREKNTLDVNQVKRKITTIEQNMNNMKEHMNKELSILFEHKIHETDNKFKNMLKEYEEKLNKTKEENEQYIKDIQTTVKQFKEKLEEFEVIKNKIFEEIQLEGKQLREENEKTQNIFKSYKKDFNLIKDRFTQLSEFIKDVRFRINIGEEVKRREYYHMSGKIDFSKKQKVQNDNNIKIYDTKYQNDKQLPDFLQNQINPNSNTNRYNDVDKLEENKKRGQFTTGYKSMKNINFFKNIDKGRNDTSFKKSKEGRNFMLHSRENKTSEEFFDENETDKNNNEEGKYFLEKMNKTNYKETNNSDIKIKGILKRSNTTNIGSSYIERFKKLENKINLFSNNNINNKKNTESIQELIEDTNINENKKIYSEKINPNNKNINNTNIKYFSYENRDKNKNKYKILNNNSNIINEEMSIDFKKRIKFFQDKTPKSIIFSGLNNRDNSNIKNISSFSEKINMLSNTRLEENQKIISPINKLGNIKEPKIDFKILPSKNTIVKSLTRIQSAFSPKYPNISGHRKSLTNSNSLNLINNNSSEKNSFLKSKANNNKASFEEDKTNTNYKNKILNKEKGFIYNSKNNIFTPKKLRTYLSPNVQILQHSVEQFNENNNTEKNDLNGIINNLQKYIKGYNSHYITKKDIKNEQKRMSKNSEYFKIKEFINGNNNDKKNIKNKTNLVEIGFNEKK